VNVITLALTGLALFLGILPGPHNPLLSVAPAAVGITVFAFFLALPRLSERGAAKRAPGRVQRLLKMTAESVRDTRHLLLRPDWRIIGAFAYLWCDIAVLAVCFAATGHSPPLAAIVLAYQIGYLSNLIPIPGGIGVLDGSGIGILVLYGVAATPAAAATLVYHAIALWIPATWGTLTFLVLRRTRHQPLTQRLPLAERRRLRADRRHQPESEGLTRSSLKRSANHVDRTNALDWLNFAGATVRVLDRCRSQRWCSRRAAEQAPLPLTGLASSALAIAIEERQL
jgi:Lysylphosphatidylglycerol synthase TM region